MNTVFLDVDGVLNSELFYRARHKRRWLKPITYYWWIKSKIGYVLNGFEYKAVSLANYIPNPKHREFKYLFNRLKEETDPQKWKWLVELCKETGCKICISSCWKNHFKTHEEWDKALTLLGFPEGTYAGRTGSRRKLRGTEIKEWTKNQPIERYAILDDDSDMLPEQMKCYFQVDPYFGLTPNHMYRIKNYFTKGGSIY